MIFTNELSVFEGDAEVIVKVIFSKDSNHPEYGQVLSDVLVLARDFHVCNYSHVK